jgi:predicted nucleic acid-binding Zn ribbon protein
MQPLASVVPFAVRRLLRQGEMSQGKLDFAWKNAVGPAIERATDIRLSENGTLEVRAADSAWRRELRHSRAMILGRLQELLGSDTIRAVKIVGRTGPQG